MVCLGNMCMATVHKGDNVAIIIIMQTEADSKCRLCKQFDETVEYIISACPIIAKEHYIKGQ